MNSYFFIRIECELDDDITKKNKQEAVMVIFIGMIMSICYMMVIDYLKKTLDIDFKRWDLMTCTVADYSVELTLPPDLW